MSIRPGAGSHPARILIVDDEPHNRKLLEVMLEPDGSIVQAAASGTEALAMVALQPPDLILLDIMMPGLDGYEVAVRIKEGPTTKNIPVIMITALDDRESRIRGLNAGAEDFLTKPVDRVELCVRVRNLLRLKEYGDHFDRYSHLLEDKVAARTADLVERTKQAAVLAEQAALLDLAQDAIIVRNMQNQILFWNRGAETMYGWLRNEAVGKNVCELLHTNFSEPTEEIHSELLEKGKWEGEAIHHKRDGTRVIVATRWALQSGTDGAPDRILTLNNDITERKDADSELLLLTERLWLATAVAKLGVWEWDLASNTMTWDTTMFEIYHIDRIVPVPYKRWAAAIHPEDLAGIQETFRKLIAKKGQGSAEYRITLSDGSIRHISAVQRAVLDDGPNVTRLIGVNMDITERKVAEAALERSNREQIRFKDEFLSHVSHELRSPLTATRQFTSILLGGSAGELNEEQRRYQEIVLKNIGQLQAMIDDLLEVTRLDTGQLSMEPTSISVQETVDDTLTTLQVTAHARRIRLSCDIPPELPLAFADQMRLRQILIILLDNAIKFTPEGGSVRIQALQQDSQFLLVQVSDTGCGIAPESADRIFERLYQIGDSIETSRKGLGLGLYICRKLVTQQGGQIWVERRVQSGATLSFTLPISFINNVATIAANSEAGCYE